MARRVQRLASRLALLLVVTVAAATASQQRRILDPSGRSVVMPARVERIGCMTGAAYEKAFLVGAADKIVVRAATYPPWMEQTNPAVRQIPVMLDTHHPNIEELLRLRPDVLFSWDDPALTRKLAASGLTVVAPQPRRANLKSVEDFIDLLKAEVMAYGEVMGGSAALQARRWAAYVDRMTQLVRARTSRLRDSEKPSVYYVRGPDALSTHGANENISWFGQMAGADMLVRRSGMSGIAQVSMEQIVVWNPEVIFVGRQYSPDLILRDPRWQQIRAVRSRRVHVIPDGVFYWDGSSEGILLLLYLAKTLHPALFADLDLRHEITDYYRRFYRYALSPRELDLMLAGRGPDGERRNEMNN